MKRTIALLLPLLLLISCTALAEAPVFGLDVLLLQQANAALINKYGLDHLTLGLFDVSIKHFGEAAIVNYTTNGSIPYNLTGEYFVLISENSVQAFWTHDDANAALWQSGDLNSPAWGVKQLTAYLNESPYTRMSFCTPYEETQHPTNATRQEDVTKETRESAKAASEIARSAVQAMYALTNEETTRLEWYSDLSSLIHYRDGHSEWHIVLQDNADVHDPITYYVTLDAETQVILYITHFSGGIG